MSATVHTQEKWGNRPRGSAPGCQNVFCFFLLSRQRGLSACTNFNHFCNRLTADANCFAHAYTGDFFSISAQGVSGSPKLPKIWYSKVGSCDRPAAQTAPFWAIGISGASRHPKNVPFVREFWWGTYGLVAISPRKSPNFGDFTT